MIQRVLLVAVCALALSGCGKSDQVADMRQAHRLDACVDSRPERQPCRIGLDALRSLGLKVGAAEHLAKRNGFGILVLSIDGRATLHLTDLVYNRIDVDTEHGIVSSIQGFG